MRIEAQRRLDRWVGVPLCRLASLLNRLLPARRARAPRRILVMLLSEMGSLVLATPMLERLRRLYPRTPIHALVFARNRDVIDLLGLVEPEGVMTIRDTSIGAMVVDTWRFVRAARRAGIDIVIDCELFSRISSLYGWLSGASVRVGFERHTQEGLYRGSFINRPVLYNPYQHIARQFVNLADSIPRSGRPLVKQRTPEVERGGLPAIDVSPAEIENMTRSLCADFHGVRLQRLVLLYPGGGLLPIRAWPVEHYATVAARLVESGWTVGVVGLAADRPVAQRVLAGLPPARRLDLTGYTRRLRDLVVLFHLADLLITNDGGPGHFAAVTPIDTIVLFGPETPALYAPLGSRTHVFHAALSCSPCLTAYNHRKSPCDGDNVCLKAITPDAVLEKALAVLATRTQGRLF